ncbi:MAG: glycoside hydrolase family 3 C-terminal domain-containing protein [Marinilabiliaceae bacterium]|nr:glycoside hydrolase family 3 C-terminal domain-containing protein [Marinilabiliaceae bacterium]
MKHLIVLTIIIMTHFTLHGQNNEFLFQDPCLPMEQRVNDLVNRMTLEEKASQMLDVAPAIDRLGIPEYNWWNESLHGVARAGSATSFPQAIGLAATWNPALIQQMADVISTEARAKFNQSIQNGQRGRYQGLTMWSPNINIFRDPRWGRGQETYGEDPYLTSRVGVAFIKGLQGDDPNYLKVVATPKHYAVHSGPEPDRHRFDAYTNPKDLWETYLPAFEATIKEANAQSVMSAYNRYLGESATASPFLLTEILREKWGFNGYVVSDCGAVYDIYKFHNIVPTAEEAAALAVKAGCDLNCGSVYSHLPKAVEQGLISEEEIDTALKRLFMARFKLGLFDPISQVPFSELGPKQLETKEHQQLALEVARQSMVLLKNDQNRLPLSTSIKKIAVIGPHANDRQYMMGNYFGTPSYRSTILEGIRETVSKHTQVYYHKGCNLADNSILWDGLPSSVFGKKGVKAEYFNNPDLNGSPLVTQTVSYIDFDWGGAAPHPLLPEKDWSVRYSATLTPAESATFHFDALTVGGFAKVAIDGKVIYDGQDKATKDKPKEIALQKGKKYRLKVEYSCHNEWISSCQLRWSSPTLRDTDRLLEEVSSSDVIVFVGGISPRLEGEEMPVEVDGFKGGDRTHLKLPQVQLELLKKLKATGKPVIFVSTSGSAMSYNWCDNNLDAILQAWYPGQAGGQAVADVLFGKYNPGGKLPVTFYQSVDDLPPFEDYHMEGRTYRYFRKEPLYPFGHGLSYADIKYSQPETAKKSYTSSEKIEVKVTVSNNSSIPANEVVQLYIKDKEASVPVPIKSLKHFRRIKFKAGESQQISFELTKDDLSLIDMDGNKRLEKGEFDIFIDGTSDTDNYTTITIL